MKGGWVGGSSPRDGLAQGASNKGWLRDGKWVVKAWLDDFYGGSLMVNIVNGWLMDGDFMI